MNHPVISSYNAETRFNYYIAEAEKHRQRKRLPGNRISFLGFPNGFISALVGLFSKSGPESYADHKALVKS